MEILMRRRYPDWEDCIRPIGQGQTPQSTNRATGEATSHETGAKSAKKAVKAALRSAPKPQCMAEFKTAESSLPKPLTDKEVDEAMKRFGELPNWALHTWVDSQSTNNHRVKGEMGPACGTSRSAPHPSPGAHGHGVRTVATRNKGSYRKRQLHSPSQPE
ncbi:hypothetical protein BX070DRAFT_246024 [Coemansia spiralis]|nr:hypothetical protein BX070DRAFT_246024 [Coemansia spiralis]